MHVKGSERIDSLPAPCFDVAASPTPHDPREMSRSKSQHETLTAGEESVREAPPDPQLQDLVPFLAGDRIFAVFADQVDATAEGKVCVPLPHAPAAVLGVVCVRGRMLTVLDPVALLTDDILGWPKSLPCVIALRGDEQLALAAHEYRDTITIAHSDIQPVMESDADTSANVTRGIARYGGEEINVLNVDQLFTAAVRHRERRRRRF